jgi:ubiquitin-like 1-activating enzyme E1 B
MITKPSFTFKDDVAAMNFVTAAANIRSHIFGIATKSRFDIKCRYLIFIAARLD